MLFTVITEQEKLLPFYVTGIGIQINQEPIIRPNGFLYYQWTYCSKGSGIFKIDGKEYHIYPGTGFFFSPNIPHEYHATNEPWETYWISFEGSNLPSLLSVFNIGLWEIFIPTDTVSCLNLFVEIENDLMQNNLEKVINTSAKLYTFLILLNNSNRVSSFQPINNKIIQLKPVITYMESHYHHYISLEELSALIGVTTHHLCKLFKNTFGITPFHYLIRLRIQISKQLLIQSPDLKIKEISHLVGYSDTSYFCSIFKKQVKQTPTDFRKLHGIVLQKD